MDIDKLNHFDLYPALIETAKRWIRIKCKFAKSNSTNTKQYKRQNKESGAMVCLQTQASDTVMDVSVQRES